MSSSLCLAPTGLRVQIVWAFARAVPPICNTQQQRTSGLVYKEYSMCTEGILGDPGGVLNAWQNARSVPVASKDV